MSRTPQTVTLTPLQIAHTITALRVHMRQLEKKGDEDPEGGEYEDRTAFFAVLAAFDSNSPGGMDRQNAFTLALGPEFTRGPLSEFERLQGCRNMGWCGSDWGSRDGSSASSVVATLADKYRAALQAHADARTLLAVR